MGETRDYADLAAKARSLGGADENAEGGARDGDRTTTWRSRHAGPPDDHTQDHDRADDERSDCSDLLIRPLEGNHRLIEPSPALRRGSVRSREHCGRRQAPPPTAAQQSPGQHRAAGCVACCRPATGMALAGARARVFRGAQRRSNVVGAAVRACVEGGWTRWRVVAQFEISPRGSRCVPRSSRPEPMFTVDAPPASR